MKSKIVIMGVSGCGKSEVARQVARQFGYTFVEGDEYHSAASIEKMSNGIALADEDRFGWLKRLNQIIAGSDQLVLACSALTPAYRDMLAKGNQELVFVYLKGTVEIIWPRMKARSDHYFSGLKLLESQFETLIEPDEAEAIIVSIDQSLDAVVADTIENLMKT